MLACPAACGRKRKRVVGLCKQPPACDPPTHTVSSSLTLRSLALQRRNGQEMMKAEQTVGGLLLPTKDGFVVAGLMSFKERMRGRQEVNEMRHTTFCCQKKKAGWRHLYRPEAGGRRPGGVQG